MAEKRYERVAKGLREFGYPDVTGEMVKAIHEAILRGDKKLPHGVIGLMVKSMYDDAVEEKGSNG